MNDLTSMPFSPSKGSHNLKSSDKKFHDSASVEIKSCISVKASVNAGLQLGPVVAKASDTTYGIKVSKFGKK